MTRQLTLTVLLLAALAPALPAIAQSEATDRKPATTPQFPVTLAQAADQAAARTGTPPAPEPGWSAPEIATAQARCNAAIAHHKAEARLLPPMREGVCGTQAPIEVTRVGSVTLSHPAIINCNLLGTLDDWLKADVQPAARRHLGGPVVHLDVMSSYSCRNAYGRKRTHLSEHALANAIDIGTFRTADGAKAAVLADWGMTEREIKRQIAAAEAAARRQELARAEALSRAEAVAKARAPRGQMAVGSNEAAVDTVTGSTPQPPASLRGVIADTFGKAAFRSIGRSESSSLGLDQPSKLGGPKARRDGAGAAAGPSAPIAGPGGEARKAFLHAIHTLACKRFGTVLGPEANDAHRNHFHLDLAARPRNNFCE